jgi:A nuclease family of the HNH/ENDO VII superfamily with conserved AHH
MYARFRARRRRRPAIAALGVALVLVLGACDTQPATDISHDAATLNARGACSGTMNGIWQYELRRVGGPWNSVGPLHPFACGASGAETAIQSHRATGLQPNTTYQYRIRAYENNSAREYFFDSTGADRGTNYDQFTTRPHPHPTSWNYGGANRTVDTDAEIDAVIAYLRAESTRDARWDGLSPTDQVTIVAAGAYERWGEEPPPFDTSGFSASVEVFDGVGDVDAPFPTDEIQQGWDYEPTAGDAGLGVILVAAAGCLKWCDDAWKAGRGLGGKLYGKLKKTKKPRSRPRNWRVLRPEQQWTQWAGSRPSYRLGQNLASGGQVKPVLSFQAHHIVASGARYARTAQQILARCFDVLGIGPNHPRNGVWLPATDADGARHGLPSNPGIATQHYYHNVNRSLWKNYYFGGLTHQRSCERVGAALDLLKAAIKRNELPY